MGQLGIGVEVNGVEVRIKAGSAKGGSVQLPGDISSQFVSGLLLAGPLMEEDLEIRVTTPLESRGYVSLTIEMLKRHGIDVQTNRDMSFFHVASQQTYRPTEHIIPGDYSSAAFLMSAAAVTSSKMLVTGLSQDESDPDSAFLTILARMGVASEFLSGRLLVEGRSLKCTKVDVSNCPDLGPIIAVLGAYAEGETEITGAERLRYKESNRLATIASELKRLGAEVKENDDGLLVSGPSMLHGGTFQSHGDHRIAMALAIAALGASDEVTIRDAQCVNKSYPTFFDDMRSLGVQIIER
jgi:3-phosphoshikimate 1-carboxyvinyltransferase